jgi:hypothetical protein
MSAKATIPNPRVPSEPVKAVPPGGVLVGVIVAPRTSALRTVLGSWSQSVFEASMFSTHTSAVFVSGEPWGGE